MLDWLTDAERRLRYQGTMPDNEEVLEQQLAEHQVTSSVHTVMLLTPRHAVSGSWFEQ